MTRRKIWGAGLAVVLVGGGIAAAWPRALEAEVTEVRQGSVIEAIYATGTVTARRSSGMRVRVAGTVRQLPVPVGSRVAAGATVVALEAAEPRRAVAEAEAALAQAEAAAQQAARQLDVLVRGARPEELTQAQAALNQARVDLRGAQLDLDRAERLSGSGATTPVVLEQAQQRREAATARVRSAEAQLDLLRKGTRGEQVQGARAAVRASEAVVRQRRVQLERARAGVGDYVLAAPFGGVVAALDVREGDMVTAGSRVAQLVDPTDFEIRTAIDEADILKVTAGQEAVVALDALPDATWSAHVARVAPRTDPVAKTAEVALRLDAPPGRLMEGLTASVNLVTAKRSGLVVPAAALVRQERATWVWTVAADGRLATASVKPGASSGETVEITGGLEAGTRVVARADNRLKVGRKVRV
ncbi:MAG: efflux RND transporter periplasmic adaptor subunit [Candidatus Sericytochromatia bacterium]|nr:efflux RND transporter periplasmic adaptor subunit [Candidatus Sericytochromatia bacterium]